MSGSGPSDSAAVMRVVRNFLLAAAVFLIGWIVAFVVRGDGDGPPPARGPDPGISVADYVAERDRVLAGLREGQYEAIVSFEEYLDADDAVALLGREPVAFLVAAPGFGTDVTDDVEGWRAETFAIAWEERDAFAELLPTVEDEGFRRQFAQDMARAEAAVEALGGDAPIVFGAVIITDAAVLRELRTTPGVRLMDVVDESAQGRPRGLRPEERDVTGEPAERP